MGFALPLQQQLIIQRLSTHHKFPILVSTEITLGLAAIHPYFRVARAG